MGPITNLTELWMDAEKQAALFLCALPDGGSDYERFRRVCEAFSMMPGHPYRRRAEEQLRLLFAIPWAPVPSFCEEIWKKTAEHLLLHPLTRSDAARITAPSGKSAEPLRLPEPSRVLDTLPTFSPDAGSATDYKSWADGRRQWLASLGDARTVRMILPDWFCPVEPDLYRVGLHLLGKEAIPSLWLTQEVRFLFEELQRMGGALLLQTACPPDAVAELLRIIRRQVGLPTVQWMPESPVHAAAFETICSSVRGSDISFATRCDHTLPAEELAALLPLGRVRVYALRRGDQSQSNCVRRPLSCRSAKPDCRSVS